jgi:hypothetical protein
MSFVLAGLLVGGCASNDPQSDVHKADWEAMNAYPPNYRAEIVAYLRTYLNDPTGIREAMVSEPVLRPKGLGHRYQACVRYTPRKEAGSNMPVRDHAPTRDHLVTFVDGKLDSLQDAKEQCANAAYAPFPELEKLTR